MSSLRRGHANLLCIVPILADDLFRGSTCRIPVASSNAMGKSLSFLWHFPKKYRNAKGAVGESNPRPLPPEGRIIPLDQRPKRKASNEDRTRDLVLTRHMLCQLSYRGDTVATGWRANTQRARQSHQKSAKEHTRRDSNPQPPDSKSGALSIAPRVPAANARDRCCNHAVELRA